MRQKDVVVLKWEWPAGRAPDARIAIRVDDVAAEGSGWFGTKRSPSIAGNLPDPYRVRGDAIGVDPAWTGKQLEIVLPRAELPEVRPGERLAMGLVSGQVCICVAVVPDDVKESELDPWLAGFPCVSK